MKGTIKLIYIFVISIAVITSCTTIEKTATIEKKEETKETSLFSKIVEQQPEFSTVTTKCTIVIDKLSSKAQIKMINGEYIQISVQPMLGIEMLRIMLTQDSLIVIDKIGSMVARESISSIKNKLPQGVGIKELQKMILGIPFIAGDTLTTKKIKNLKFSSTEDGVVMRDEVTKTSSVSFAYDNKSLLKNTTIEYNGVPLIGCDYSQYKADATGVLRPTNVVVRPLDKKLGIPFNLTIKNIAPEWNKKVVVETNVSSRYKKVSLENLIKKYIK